MLRDKLLELKCRYILSHFEDLLDKYLFQLYIHFFQILPTTAATFYKHCYCILNFL